MKQTPSNCKLRKCRYNSISPPENSQECVVCPFLKVRRWEPVSQPLDTALPTEAINKGYGLTWWSPAVFQVDPVILYKHNREVYRWDYVPSMMEVWEKIKELEVEF